MLIEIQMRKPGSGDASSKGDILPGGDEHVLRLERLRPHHRLPGKTVQILRLCDDTKLVCCEYGPGPDVGFQPFSDVDALLVLPGVQVPLQSARIFKFAEHFVIISFHRHQHNLYQYHQHHQQHQHH